MGRAIYLTVPEVRRLDHWCELLRNAFQRTPYLVGSVLTRADHRDVDVRIILEDDVHAALPIHVLDLNMLLSNWGQLLTALPIDCQVQSQSEWDAETEKRDPAASPNPRGHIEAWRRGHFYPPNAERPD